MQARHFTQEDGADLAAYEGEEPEWMDWQYDGISLTMMSWKN